MSLAVRAIATQSAQLLLQNNKVCSLKVSSRYDEISSRYHVIKLGFICPWVRVKSPAGYVVVHEGAEEGK